MGFGGESLVDGPHLQLTVQTKTRHPQSGPTPERFEAETIQVWIQIPQTSP